MKLKIEKLSNLGHGIAFDNKGQKIFVPKSVTGDEISASITKKTKKFTLAKIEKITKESKLRTKAPCQYFEKCGGCSLQHLKSDFYEDFKINNAFESFKQSNIKINKNKLEFAKIGVNSRRRAIFHVTNDNNLGFFAQNSNNLVKIDNCLILQKEIECLIPDLQVILRKLSKKLISEISICAFDNIIQVIFQLKQDGLNIDDLEHLNEFAKKHKSLNISSQYKKQITPIYQSSTPFVKFGDFKVMVSEDIFLQATIKGQDEIIQTIKKEFSDNQFSNVVDIYSGVGTYSFGIINEVQKITAYEGHELAVKQFNLAVRQNNITHKAEIYERDLFYNPLREEELNDFDVAIINPPRNGATPQIEKLVNSSIKNIIYVSCNPQTFAKDAKILIENGFEIEKIKLIDQFIYSSHIELVVVLKKP